MNKVGKIIIVVALIAIVGAVMALKEYKKAGVQSSAVQSSEPVTATPAPEPVTAEASPDDEAESAPSTPAKQSLPKLLDLGAGKCIPCKMMFPVLDELEKEYAGKLEVVFIDVWENPDEAKQYDIRMIPTQIFYDASGKELFRHEGFYSKEDILAKWKELAIALETES